MEIPYGCSSKRTEMWVDEGFLSSDSDYVYETDLGGAEDLPLIAVHLDQDLQRY